MFKLSMRSKDRMAGINPKLIKVVNYAITVTKVDFGVTQGLRTIEQQRALLAARKTQTMKSKHLTGDAVDLIAYVGGHISWDLDLYDDIADAMKLGAIKYNVKMRWGGAWTVPDIAKWNKTMEAAQMSYIDQRRKEKRRPFIDGPHFELN